ncbi:MAG TPA: ADP-ribosylglycohydrolase family protein [Abditibacteriaceae bacterium]|jgi:ADP-ribosylglycohydrolase
MTSSPTLTFVAPFPQDYAARVYAGVLGKIIGVYLGRPFEQWPYDRIESTFGDVNYYVHDKVGVPLIVTDDDITGTFTFIRALEDHGLTSDISAEQIGWTWLNYIIENRTILWWGGLGYAAEHTAFLRLKAGVPAPRSGSIELNGRQVAEEIGSQIFIEGWAFVAPGNPALAAELARKAASVSHDREGIYGAQVIAVMVSQAFVESDLNALLDLALTFIPSDSEIALCISDVRMWHKTEKDWRITRQKIVENYGYERYGTNCPIVSNHAIVILGLLYGDDNFSKSLQITCNAAYDTDCNAANVGAILGVKNGLACIDEETSGRDWRGPVGDRLYLPTAEGGRCFSDALTVSEKLVALGRNFAGLEPQVPKGGARFHFSQPGSVQGFFPVDESLQVGNIAYGIGRALELRVAGVSDFWDVATEVFDAKGSEGSYGLIGNPSVFSGQTLHVHVEAASGNSGPLQVALLLYRYHGDDPNFAEVSASTTLETGQKQRLEWKIPDFDGQPIAKVGLRLTGASLGDVVVVDSYTWHGEPHVSFHAPHSGGRAWQRAWVDAVDSQIHWENPYFTLVQNRGRGLVSTGTSDWRNYRAAARFKMRAAHSGGLAVRYGGLERYYGLMLRRAGFLTLFKRRDGVETILGEVEFNWEYESLYDLFLSAQGSQLTAGVADEVLLSATDANQPLLEGGVALLIEEGCLMAERVTVAPLS